MSKNSDVLRLQFLLRNDEQIIVPMNKNKEVKSFIFYNNIVDISTKEIAKIEFKKDLFLSLTQGIYLNEFLIQLFHNKFDVFLSSISFDIKDEVYL